MADLEKQACENKLLSLSDQQKRNAVQNLIRVIDKYKSSLDKLVGSQGLDINYIKNVLNYSNYVTLHLNFVNMVISKQPDTIFLSILSCMVNLYPLFYKMESLARYPLKEVSYNNLDLLSTQKDTCKKIIEMTEELFSLVKNDLS